ncbi:MAG: helix-turn-helix domain-containing protein [Pseudohongiellaceae bacterium]
MTTSSEQAGNRHVTVIAVPQALGSTVTIPLEMLSAANDIARAGHRDRLLMNIELAGMDADEVILAGGLRLRCERRLADIHRTDLVIVPGLWGNPRAAVRRYPELVCWLGERIRAGSTVCAITTGSHFVAATGLLDGRQATTHWRFFAQFQSLYPRVKLQRRRFMTQSGSLYCTGSVNAARDIMLHFIARFYDEAVTSQVAQHFTHELKRSYESMLLDEDQRRTHHDETIIKAQEWLQDNYSQPVRINELARRFRLSVRSLNRRFKSATNSTPLQFLQDVRINHAKDLLKQSNLVVAEVADRVGYQDSSYFTGLFKKLNAVTPNEYRRLVRNKLFVAESEESGRR